MAILPGIIIHLGLSAFFGVLFAVRARYETLPRMALLSGLVYGAVIWLVMTFMILPLVIAVLPSRVSVNGA